MTPRILIADDEVLICQMLETILTDEGFEVELAHSGDELIRKAQDHIPDLLLVDLDGMTVGRYTYQPGWRWVVAGANDRTIFTPAACDVVFRYAGGAVGTLAQSWEIPSSLKGVRLSRVFGFVRTGTDAIAMCFLPAWISVSRV